MPLSSERAATLANLSPDVRVARIAELAAVGFAARLLTPGRMHAVNGHLHNAAMLSDLLGRQAGDAKAEGKNALILQRRIAAIAQEVAALEREIRRWQSLLAFPVAARFGRCDASSALADAVTVLRAEAVRLQVKLWTHVPSEPVWIGCSEGAFVQAVVVSTTAALQSIPQSATISLVARANECELIVEISTPRSASTGGIDDPLEPDLVSELARASGARFDSGPPLVLGYPRVSGSTARIDA